VPYERQACSRPAEAVAKELPPLDLNDALELTIVIARKDPRRHPRVAARWLLRYLEECNEATIDEVAMLASCLAALAGDRYQDAALALRAIAERATSRRRARSVSGSNLGGRNCACIAARKAYTRHFARHAEVAQAHALQTPGRLRVITLFPPESHSRAASATGYQRAATRGCRLKRTRLAYVAGCEISLRRLASGNASRNATLRTKPGGRSPLPPWERLSPTPRWESSGRPALLLLIPPRPLTCAAPKLFA
jgi:hypothetical protein